MLSLRGVCGARHDSEREEALATRESAAGTEAGRRVEYCAISGSFLPTFLLLFLGSAVPRSKDKKPDGRKGDRDHARVDSFWHAVRFKPEHEGVPEEETVRVVVRAEEIIAGQADGPEDADQDEEAEGLYVERRCV